MFRKQVPPHAHLEPLIRKSACYAGIGSRSTPDSILDLIARIAEVLADHRLILRSGGAPGADTAFEEGCDRREGKKEIFLPWRGFNDHPSPFYFPPKRAEDIAAQIHPAWKAVKPQYRAFHARNVQQVCGEHVDHPVDFVLFYAEEKNGRVQGGTATAVHLARELQLPTFNLWDHSTRQQWEQIASTREPRGGDFFARFFRRSLEEDG